MTAKNNITIENIRCVILGGHLDFGRCALASQLPTALWPIGDNTALEHLLCDLRRQGIRQATLCANGHSALFQQTVSIPDSMTVTYIDEPLPLGTAGCIRAAAGGDAKACYLVLNANMISLPDIKTILDAHCEHTASMTIVLSLKGPDGSGGDPPVPQAYLCNGSVVEYIPGQGYFDIKEGLIPLLVRDNQIIRTHSQSRPSGIFRNRAEYLTVVSDDLKNSQLHPAAAGAACPGPASVRIDPGAVVDPECRIFGPVRIMDGAVVGKGTLIFGPGVIRRDVTVGSNTLLSNCVLWDGCRVGDGCEIHNSIVYYHAQIPENRVIENAAVTGNRKAAGAALKGRGFASHLAAAGRSYVRSNPAFEAFGRSLHAVSCGLRRHQEVVRQGLFAVVLIAVLMWSYRPEIRELWKIWQKSDEYSSGLIVPFLAVYVLWARRHSFSQEPVKGSVWGLGLLAFAQAVRYFGVIFMYSSAERVSLVMTLASLVLLVLGGSIFRKAVPILLFLLLMLPFPQSVHAAITLPLQNLATQNAVFFLELFGYSVMREGNIIHINDTYVAVAEACNGLRMVTSFFIIITMVALLVRRNRWEKIILIVSGVPIALLCNSIRLTFTAMAFTYLDLERWEQFFHDFGGYAMMPVALVMATAELWLLKKIIITSESIEQKQPFKAVIPEPERRIPWIP